jgi:hypothetical protein
MEAKGLIWKLGSQQYVAYYTIRILQRSRQERISTMDC